MDLSVRITHRNGKHYLVPSKSLEFLMMLREHPNLEFYVAQRDIEMAKSLERRGYITLDTSRCGIPGKPDMVYATLAKRQ